MKNLVNYITEGEKDIDLSSITSKFKDSEETILSMIAKRVDKWDANIGRYSREPMFLCDWNRQSIGWSTISSLQIELGDGDENIDGGTNYKMFDGFLTDYLSGKVTENDQYILGVFIDRCFIPITDKNAFEKIWVELT